ncbi:hypothetical protein BCR43DRAFT_566773 [Syncephalastrum racemosum]|uniref:Putative transcription factor kapC n=1 Tax=Syncephalastrum racemosum TaxID=13706 RepID=A0A1X2H1C1_SYNRA|nr:hypothetical protein BCR43DRAFT_566773 [Syncephalastrum racemosum]
MNHDHDIDDTQFSARSATTPPLERKKPGRKPNPASPALRKAQNRAAQRAFRERKERHIAELEQSSKQYKEERDQLLAENVMLRERVNTLAFEAWHLKGDLLTLHLTCFLHNIAVPRHHPYIDKQDLDALTALPAELANSYLASKEHNKVPEPLPSNKKLMAPPRPHHHQQQQTHVSPATPIVVAKDGLHTIPNKQLSLSRRSSVRHTSFSPVPRENQQAQSRSQSPVERSKQQQSCYLGSKRPCEEEEDDISHTSLEDTKKKKIGSGSISPVDAPSPQFSAQPILLTREPVPSFNLAGFQAMRLRLQLQSACAKLDPSYADSFVLEPTTLQLNIPHDPRIDLIPMPAMRDRMILFRDFFDLDDCFRCILEGSSFAGGDPIAAASWQLPAEFYEKFWFLAHDYSCKEVKQRWPRLQAFNTDVLLLLLHRSRSRRKSRYAELKGELASSCSESDEDEYDAPHHSQRVLGGPDGRAQEHNALAALLGHPSSSHPWYRPVTQEQQQLAQHETAEFDGIRFTDIEGGMEYGDDLASYLAASDSNMNSDSFLPLYPAFEEQTEEAAASASSESLLWCELLVDNNDDTEEQ